MVSISDESFNRDFAYITKILRKEYNLTQAQFSQKCGLSRAAISNIETEKSNRHTFDTIYKVITAFNELDAPKKHKIMCDRARELEAENHNLKTSNARLDAEVNTEYAKNDLLLRQFNASKVKIKTLEEDNKLLEKRKDFLKNVLKRNNKALCHWKDSSNYFKKELKNLQNKPNLFKRIFSKKIGALGCIFLMIAIVAIARLGA